MIFVGFGNHKKLTSPGLVENHDQSFPLQRGINRNEQSEKSAIYFKINFTNINFTIRRTLGSLFILTLFSLPAFSQTFSSFNPKDAHYLWPTSASHALSSTFGETRAGHFHAALDIKTWGRRGYPVYATRSGTLHRVAIGPTGYGKVLYLKHSDGSYSVYAHLLRFKKSIQQWADSIRFRDYSSSIDRIVDSLHIHIKRGEKIALSGASGIGPPHLHFELRTPDEHPFNPLRTNLSVKDTRPPVFSGLAVEPFSIKSKIEGENKIYTKGVSRAKDRAHFGTISVSGPVGLAVNLFDQADGVHNVYAVYTLNMTVDGKRVFQSKVDQFSYDETHQMLLDRIYPLLQSSGRAYQRLYIADGNTLSFYQTQGNRGRLNLSPGRHHIVIKAADYFGNTRTADLTLKVEKPRDHSLNYQQKNETASPDAMKPSRWQWFHNWVNIPEDDFRQLTLFSMLNTIPIPRFYNHKQNVAVNLQHSSQFYFSEPGQHYFIAKRVNPAGAAYLTTPHNRAYASFATGSFYDTTSVAITRQQMAPDSVQITIFPDNQPLASHFDLTMEMDSLQRRDSTLSFYHYYPKSSYLRKLATRRKGDYIKTSPSSLGTFLVLSDSLGPEIKSPHIVQRPDGQWLIYLPVEDNRSGIDYQKTEIYVNGVRGITEYEPEDDRLVYYHPEFVPQQDNSVKIIAYDKVGNKTVRQIIIPH